MIGFWRWLTGIEFQTKRWMVDLRPDFGWPHWVPRVVHGGDEYGNCSIFAKSKLFMVVFFYEPCMQTEVELPQPGECEWVDHKFYE
jgi:hypothetical protein